MGRLGDWTGQSSSSAEGSLRSRNYYGLYSDLDLVSRRNVNWTQWDTANVYSNGDSERVIAQAIKEYDLPRQKLVLMTKAWSCVGEEQFHAYPILDDLRRSKDYVNQFGEFFPPFFPSLLGHGRQVAVVLLMREGLSRSALITSVNDSLKRLETDYIDMFWIHRFDPFTPIEETMRALHDLVTAGKIRYIGASSMWTYQFAMMQFCAEKNGWTKFIAMQVRLILGISETGRDVDTELESLQSTLPRGRTRDEQILQRHWCSYHSREFKFHSEALLL